MRKIIPLCVLLLALSGCSLFNAESVATVPFDPAASQKTVYALKTGYQAALTLAEAYNSRPRCGAPKSPILCSSQSAIDAIRKAAAATSATINSAETAVRSLTPDATVVGAAITAATNALDAFRAVTAIYSPATN